MAKRDPLEPSSRAFPSPTEAHSPFASLNNPTSPNNSLAFCISENWFMSHEKTDEQQLATRNVLTRVIQLSHQFLNDQAEIMELKEHHSTEISPADVTLVESKNTELQKEVGELRAKARHHSTVMEQLTPQISSEAKTSPSNSLASSLFEPYNALHAKAFELLAEIHAAEDALGLLDARMTHDGDLQTYTRRITAISRQQFESMHKLCKNLTIIEHLKELTETFKDSIPPSLVLSMFVSSRFDKDVAKKQLEELCS